MPRSSRLRPSKKRKPILLSEIKFDSTCVTLDIPFSLACGNCKTKLDPTINKRKSKFVKERNKCKRRRCQQYWDSSWTKGKDATEGYILQHNLVRSYLQIESAVKIDYFKAYDSKSKQTKMDPPHNPSPSSNHPPTINKSVEGATSTLPPMNDSLTDDYPPATTDNIPPSIPQTVIRASTLNEQIVSSLSTSSYEDLIVSNIRNFLKTSNTKGGTHHNVDTATRDAVLTACTFGLPNEVKKDSI